MSKPLVSANELSDSAVALREVSEELGTIGSIAEFVTGAILKFADEGLSDGESTGYFIVMTDMMDRISKASALLDRVRNGEGAASDE